MKQKELSGRMFGRLTVVKIINEHCGNKTKWLCECKCGGNKIITQFRLIYGGTKSCGCLQIEAATNSVKTHGETSKTTVSPEYGAWRHIKNRCYNKNVDGYENYGGRGIKMCNRWLRSFNNFLVDMGRRPTPNHSIDRYPNKNGHYEKNNCRWATQREQAANKRNNVWFEFGGKKMIQADWARELKIDVRTIHARLKRMTFYEMMNKFY